MYQNEAIPGLILIAAAAIAMALANSPFFARFDHLLHGPLPWTPFALLPTLHDWIDEALMAVFFLTAGLEIKREIVAGALSQPAARRLPVLAAISGMIVPALVYLAVVGGEPPLQDGWAIPAATDIAFALGILALAGKGVPPALRLFLLTLAIADDMGAVAIVALLFTRDLQPVWLMAGGAVTMAMMVLNLRGVRAVWPYAALAVTLWVCVLHSGIQPTVAGVVAAMTVPVTTGRRGNGPLVRMEHAVAPWSALVIVPLFGLANAGVRLGGELDHPSLPLAIALGLALGKPVGIYGAVTLARRLGLAELPQGTTPMQMAAGAVLCGVGFTMSLFIASLAFPGQPALIAQARLGILGGTLVSAVVGIVWLRLACRPARSAG